MHTGDTSKDTAAEYFAKGGKGKKHTEASKNFCVSTWITLTIKWVLNCLNDFTLPKKIKAAGWRDHLNRNQSNKTNNVWRL